MTLTEFNQNPSQAVRMADAGDVIVLRRGKPAYRLLAIPSGGETAWEKLQELRAAGLLRPAKNPRGPKVWRHTGNLADWQEELERDRNRIDDLFS
jgi:antitoxin (DNA-binding transcriptional repressor) of toxin-antitoxin stability system